MALTLRGGKSQQSVKRSFELLLIAPRATRSCLSYVDSCCCCRRCAVCCILRTRKYKLLCCYELIREHWRAAIEHNSPDSINQAAAVAYLNLDVLP
jgi:hypothetical protein